MRTEIPSSRRSDRAATVAKIVTAIFVSGLVALACYIDSGPLVGARMTVSAFAVVLTCLTSPAVGLVWQRVDRQDR